MDYYAILGVNRNDSIDIIKKTYKELARKYHPDVSKEKDCQQKFIEITAAFEILTDPVKRQQFDINGYVGRRPPKTSYSKKPVKPVKTKEDFEKEREEKERKEANVFTKEELEKVSCSYFGGPLTGKNILTHYKLEPYQFVTGCTVMVPIKKRKLCSRCIGDGKFLQACKVCGNDQLTRMACPRCFGEGIEEEKCPICKGEGVSKWIINEVKFTVPPRSSPGFSLVAMGEGEDAPLKSPGYAKVIFV